MKSAKWIILVLMVLTATLLLVRHQHGEATTTAPGSPSAEAPAEPAPSPSTPAAPTEAATANTPVPAETPRAATPEDGNHLHVIVQNETGQALDGAEVRAIVRAGRGNASLTNFNRTFTASAFGIADVLWPKQTFEQLELVVSKDEYAPRKVAWDLKTGDDIPPSYTVQLKGSVHVGGIVVDPEGNPVADALVTLSRFWRGGEDRPNKGEESAFPTQKQTTGADGRWTARNLPADLLERIFITGSHTNFISVTVSMDRKPEIEKSLREGTYRLELKRGLEVRGRVINEQQQPIADAQVWAGRKYSRERQEAKTDAQGRFGFRNVNEGEVDFSASAAGYAPDAKTHNVSATGEELVFRLAKGSVIRGVVQDESSQPIEGVRVALAGSPGEDSYDRYEFSTTTDSAGRFEWNSAPNKPAPFYFGKMGYEQKRGVRLKPGEDSVVTLRQSRQVQGQVLDAETSQPVTRFTIAIGSSSGGGQFYADSGSTKEFKSDQGTFTIDLSEERQNALQASAKDYAEQTQTVPTAEGGQAKVLFKLKSSKPLEGIVVTPDGRPVAGASVALVDDSYGGRSIQIGRGKLRDSGSRAKPVTTDGAGHFEIPSPPETGTIVTANGAGYGSASLAEVRASGVLILQALGRIEGQLLRGSTPAAGQELLLNSPNGGIYFEFETTKQTTDAEGRFAFENVPAGTLSIVRLVKTNPRSWAHSHRTDVVVKAGETTQVVLGATDATLSGQVKFETPPAETDYTVSARLNMATPQPPAGLSPEQRVAYMSSPEWKEQMKNMKYYAAVVGSDGTLTLDSVAPGQYTLVVTAEKSSGETFNPGAKPLARGQITVTVPAGSGPATPIQIGDVLLKPSP